MPGGLGLAAHAMPRVLPVESRHLVEADKHQCVLQPVHSVCRRVPCNPGALPRFAARTVSHSTERRPVGVAQPPIEQGECWNPAGRSQQAGREATERLGPRANPGTVQRHGLSCSMDGSVLACLGL